MKKIFIYYSLTGTGDKIAKYLEDKKITLRKIEIEEKNKLSDNMFLKIIVGGYKALINYKDELVNFDNDINKYDEIIIGSPIWNSRLSSPINSVLDKLDLKDKRLTFILYSGSGTSKAATKKINNLYPKAKIIDLKSPINNNEINKLKDL